MSESSSSSGLRRAFDVAFGGTLDLADDPWQQFRHPRRGSHCLLRETFEFVLLQIVDAEPRCDRLQRIDRLDQLRAFVAHGVALAISWATLPRTPLTKPPASAWQ